ncbi:Holliday junction branch migration protein RuvA [Aerococcus suis]|uniref:Holliday junction branch migration complex subunit RuvA n=1 Tax=Aerococcus suis TaxID=371602 RepID=A0A1W1YLS5_9LACT|nr:Holliday junction branch migration protein RuvA [Aerococcus suis]MCI7240857.1 Holliday junction branch migration protein RuvA [Aerococcus suis]MDD7758961.1 Holliday junction branch migration protein RuvA [Aerococcus suis]MDY4646164.1 Holliday junction branch migration protein RuvA [Aerococcus suis]SMC37082.1 Holliday junction DNA helicase subunit RuvA [Aerococcus suis]
MFEYIIGKLDHVAPDGIVVETYGIGYFIYMANPYRFQAQVGQECKVWIYQSVSENDLRLYGFISKAEKYLFMQLISVNGIGPKSALSILSLEDNNGLVQAIQNENLTFLTKFPGVGKKTAQRIILDLQDKIVSYEDVGQEKPSDNRRMSDNQPNYITELEEALASLGYSAREIKRAVKQSDFTGVETTADAIRVALRFITKG